MVKHIVIILFHEVSRAEEEEEEIVIDVLKIASRYSIR